MSANPASIAIGIQDPSVLVGKLTTLGRRTGSPRKVEINLIYLDGKFNATSASVNNKHWCATLKQEIAASVVAGVWLRQQVCVYRFCSSETLHRC